MKLPYAFYHRPCLEVAHDLVGKVLVCGDQKLRISETEAYVGESDTACHAHKGRTKRTEVMYREAGTIYICGCGRPRQADQEIGNYRRIKPPKHLR